MSLSGLNQIKNNQHFFHSQLQGAANTKYAAVLDLTLYFCPTLSLAQVVPSGQVLIPEFWQDLFLLLLPVTQTQPGPQQ